MCERFSFINKLSALEESLRVETTAVKEQWQANVNISLGEQALVLTSHEPKALRFIRFGFTPHWSKKKMDIRNARSEGEHNLANDPNYTKAKGIIRKPAFRQAIRTQRCLIIANGFLLGDFGQGLSSKFYFVYPDDRRIITFAGIWDTWKHPYTEEETHGFAIITTSANNLIQKTGHQRSPVIIEHDERRLWLHQDVMLSDVTSLLKPFDASEYNAHPISPLIHSPAAKDVRLLQPIAQPLQKRFKRVLSQAWELEGMGSTAARKRRKVEEKQP